MEYLNGYSGGIKGLLVVMKLMQRDDVFWYGVCYCVMIGPIRAVRPVRAIRPIGPLMAKGLLGQ